MRNGEQTLNNIRLCIHLFHLVYNCFTPTRMNRIIKATRRTRNILSFCSWIWGTHMHIKFRYNRTIRGRVIAI